MDSQNTSFTSFCILPNYHRLDLLSLHKKRRSLNPRNMGKQENRKNNSLRVEVNMMESFKFLALLMGLFLAFHKNFVDSQQGNIYRQLSRYKQLGG